MMCEMCGKNQASTFLTLVVNDKVKKMHLCPACASESGLDGSHPISITDVLLGLGGKKETSGATSHKTCPRCHMRIADFKKTSRLGCQDCYEAFAVELDPLLDAMHKGKQHVGKTPAHVPAPALMNLAALKKSLDDAIRAENYEEAARLRDKIREDSEKPARRPAKKIS